MILLGCESVRVTSKTADEILSKVTVASQDMSKASTIANTEFITFLDKEGVQISNELKSHFTKLDTYLMKTNENLSIINENTQEYNKDATIIQVNPTEAIPLKTTFIELDEIK
jgi:hypothetical protein